ncbi:MAG TPA: universal stress protein [Anaerolineales bacterium]|nr:universal stress protein [Anaerolineales bacterium]
MYKHLLVPLDGSSFSEKALQYAEQLAQLQTDTKLSVCQIVQPSAALLSEFEASTMQLYVQLQEIAVKEAQEYLQKVENSLQAAGFCAKGYMLVEDDIARAVLNLADEIGADTIAMSTHGRGGMGRWVFGSVADRVLQQARIPVLLVPATRLANTDSAD